MRDWFPDELVDELEQMDADDLAPQVAEAVVRAIEDDPNEDRVLLLGVAKNRSDDKIIKMLFATRGRFVQYTLLQDCGCGGRECVLVTWGPACAKELKELERGWVDLHGKSELLCMSQYDRDTFLYGRAIWLINPTIH